MVTMLVLILLPVAFLLPPGTGAGEIIGGQEARPHSRPYMAYLKIQRGHNFSSCGGFLVSENFVLTAAHCNGDSITVLLGSHNVAIDEPESQKIRVRRQIPHPEYNHKTFENDIMLLQLARKSELDECVTTICLPTRKDRGKPKVQCSVAGWGLISLERRTSTLHEVNLTVTEDRVCRKKYGRSYKPSTMLCVGNRQKMKTALKGDSGGPLVCDGECGIMAEGIVSHGKKNSIVPPAVYTRISPFMPWITRTMRRI